MSALTITVPMPPNLTNRDSGRSHWRVIHREKKAYAALCDAMQASGQLPPPPAEPFTRATLRSTMYLGAAMDEENAAARHKVVIDWLRTRGYIVDDRKKCLKWEAFPEQIVKRDGNYRITITLTPQEQES